MKMDEMESHLARGGDEWVCTYANLNWLLLSDRFHRID
jgi:hypothetical protein